MFERFKSIFAKEEKKQMLEYSQLKRILSEKRIQREKEIFFECGLKRDAIFTLFDEMLDAIKILRDAEIVEKRAKASETIKNRFAEKSSEIIKKRLEDLRKYSQFDNLDQIKDFIEIVADVNKKIQISPKEVMHIKFFFTDEFSNVGRKITLILNANDELKKQIESDGVNTIKCIDDIIYNIENNARIITESRKKIKEFDEQTNDLEENRNKMILKNLDELVKIRDEMKDSEKKLNHASQFIISELSVVEKVLKKCFHNKTNDNKQDFNIINEYIKSSYNAFLNDKGAKIRDILLKSLIMVKDEKINIDQKSIKKVENLLENMDTMVSYRDDALTLMLRIADLKEQEKKWVDQEVRNKEIMREQTGADERIKKMKEAIAKINNDIQATEDETEHNKNILTDNVSQFLGYDVEIIFAEQKL